MRNMEPNELASLVVTSATCKLGHAPVNPKQASNTGTTKLTSEKGTRSSTQMIKGIHRLISQRLVIVCEFFNSKGCLTYEQWIRGFRTSACALNFATDFFKMNLSVFFLLINLLDWCSDSFPRIFHVYDSGWNYGGTELDNAREKPPAIRRLR